MKKVITAAVALAMALSMGTVSTFASTETLTKPGDETIDVQAKYNDEVVVPDIYSVDLEWDKMEFTYTASGTKTWNPTTKQYDIDSTAVWAAEGNIITVTNNSNKAVTADFKFDALASYNTVTSSFTSSSVSLLSADNKDALETDLKKSTKLTLSGTLEENVSDFIKVGAITITIK